MADENSFDFINLKFVILNKRMEFIDNSLLSNCDSSNNDNKTSQLNNEKSISIIESNDINNNSLMTDLKVNT